MPENVVDQMNDVLVHKILLLRNSSVEERLARTPNAAQAQPNCPQRPQQALKQITLTCPTQPPGASIRSIIHKKYV